MSTIQSIPSFRVAPGAAVSGGLLGQVAQSGNKDAPVRQTARVAGTITITRSISRPQSTVKHSDDALAMAKEDAMIYDFSMISLEDFTEDWLQEAMDATQPEFFDPQFTYKLICALYKLRIIDNAAKNFFIDTGYLCAAFLKLPNPAKWPQLLKPATVEKLNRYFQAFEMVSRAGRGNRDQIDCPRFLRAMGVHTALIADKVFRDQVAFGLPPCMQWAGALSCVPGEVAKTYVWDYCVWGAEQSHRFGNTSHVDWVQQTRIVKLEAASSWPPVEHRERFWTAIEHKMRERGSFLAPAFKTAEEAINYLKLKYGDKLVWEE